MIRLGLASVLATEGDLPVAVTKQSTARPAAEETTPVFRIGIGLNRAIRFTGNQSGADRSRGINSGSCVARWSQAIEHNETQDD